MIRTIKAAMIVAALSGVAMSGAALADTGIYYIHNGNSQVSVQRVWTARSGEQGDPWHEADLNHAINPGETSPFSIGGGDLCFYDVKIMFSDQVVQQFSNVNVCHGDTVNAS